MEEKTIEQVLDEEKLYVGTTVGTSMEPLLRTRRDTVVIEPPKGRLAKNDVALYRRGEDYVLHRVIGVLPDSYVILGDNCFAPETGITDAQILGVMTAFFRKGKYFTVNAPRYRRYVAAVTLFRPLRRAFLWLRAKAAKAQRTMRHAQ